jgi:hypothetical protein
LPKHKGKKNGKKIVWEAKLFVEEVWNDRRVCYGGF